MANHDFFDTVGVATIGDAVLAIEPGGATGFFASAALSQGGRAASFFWDVNALTALGFSRDGAGVAGVSDWNIYDFADITDPESLTALEGLDFADIRHCYARAFLAMERFTGVGFSRDDIARIEERDVFYPIVAAING
ncbi:hypothetical protein [Pseudonocardia spinosispora]|uniref:hypothetical protein n=1 Tax=Pseudonocardia spinosispora TaxID=103441 RepID=UPI000410BC06|nr:hypothetical protein [Pseudonocardia spinosispora]